MPSTAPHPSAESGFTLVEIIIAMFILLVGVLGVAVLVNVGNAKTSSNLRRESATNLAREIVERSREVGYTTLVADANNRPAALLALPGLGNTGAANTWTITDRRNITYTVSAAVCEIDDKSDGIGPRNLSYCDMTTPPPGGDQPGAGTSLTAVYADLAALGININVDLGGTGFTPICNILGANPSLNSMLGGLAGLVASGADIRVCGTTGSSEATIDRNPDDIKRVTVKVSWSQGAVVQSTLIPNPDGGAALT